LLPIVAQSFGRVNEIHAKTTGALNGRLCKEVFAIRSWHDVPTISYTAYVIAQHILSGAGFSS
jgi:hypothetical protein